MTISRGPLIAPAIAAVLLSMSLSACSSLQTGEKSSRPRTCPDGQRMICVEESASRIRMRDNRFLFCHCGGLGAHTF